MISRLTFLVAIGVSTSFPALACSKPKREHPILASHAPAAIQPGSTVLKFVVNEALLPERRSRNPENVWFRDLQGVRGTLLDSENRGNGPPVEVLGTIRLICFYPDDRYERTADGQLIVWISGTVSQDDGRLTIRLDGHEAASSGFVWTRIRWNGIE